MDEKIAIKQEYEKKEKETADFIAVLTDKAVYFDEEKDKYILASRKQINELVKEAYKNQDFIKANELLESAKNTLGKDIKKESREIASKSMRLSAKHYFMLVGQAYQKDMSLADVVRYKICDYLKENLKDLEINKEKKEMLERSLELWENKKSIKPKKSYDNYYNFENDEKYMADYILYEKYLFKEECKKDGFSNEQIDLIMQYYGSNELYGEVELNLSKANKDGDILINVDIEQTIFLNKWDILKEEFSNKFKESSLTNLEKHIYEKDIDDGDRTAAFDYSFYTPEFYLNLHPSLKINMLDFEYKNEKLLVEQLFGKLCTIEEKDIDAIKNKIDENIKKDNYAEAQELSEQLAYYDSCKTISNKIIGLLFNYINDKEIITFTIPKCLLLWFNALGGDKRLPDLIVSTSQKPNTICLNKEKQTNYSCEGRIAEKHRKMVYNEMKKNILFSKACKKISKIENITPNTISAQCTRDWGYIKPYEFFEKAKNYFDRQVETLEEYNKTNKQPTEAEFQSINIDKPSSNVLNPTMNKISDSKSREDLEKVTAGMFKDVGNGICILKKNNNVKIDLNCPQKETIEKLKYYGYIPSAKKGFHGFYWSLRKKVNLIRTPTKNKEV